MKTPTFSSRRAGSSHMADPAQVSLRSWRIMLGVFTLSIVISFAAHAVWYVSFSKFEDDGIALDDDEGAAINRRDLSRATEYLREREAAFHELHEFTPAIVDPA